MQLIKMMKCKAVEMLPETRWELRHESMTVHSSHSSQSQLGIAWECNKKNFPDTVLYPYQVVLTRIAMVEQK